MFGITDQVSRPKDQQNETALMSFVRAADGDAFRNSPNPVQFSMNGDAASDSLVASKSMPGASIDFDHAGQPEAVNFHAMASGDEAIARNT